MIGGIITGLAMLGFLAVVIYVFVLRRRRDFDEQARIPLGDDEPGSGRDSGDGNDGDRP